MTESIDLSDEAVRADARYYEGRAAGWENGYDAGKAATVDLVAKATALVKLMDEAETHHGGLIGSVTLRAKNELRLELSKWK